MKKKSYFDISGQKWAAIKRGAKSRNYDFYLTIEQGWELYVKQNRRCALTGTEIGFQDKTASLDRIDSTKGYMLDNVQWVHKNINYLKRGLPENELLEWCEVITNGKEEIVPLTEVKDEPVEAISYSICKGKGKPYEVGQEYGLLKITSFWLEKPKNKKWRETYCSCVCKCGNIVERVKGDTLRSKHKKSCGCLLHKNGNLWQGFGDIPKTYWSWTQKNAQVRNIPFNISIEQAWEVYIRQGGKCALSGVDIGFGTKKQYTASLDRVDSTKRYEADNVQWVHKQVNLMKWKMPQGEFLEWCRKIVEHH